MKHFFDIPSLKKAYCDGKNISELMKSNIHSEINTKEIIETAYDLQAGSYIRSYEQNPELGKEYFKEKSLLIKTFFPKAESLLDCGCGELTNSSLSHFEILSTQIKKFYAFDISWSRIFKGKQFFSQKTQSVPICFTADMEHIPLPDNSIDVVTTSHALEPNHGQEKPLLTELLRVSRYGLALFEPSWELGGEKQQKRMDFHSYVRNMPHIISELGFELIQHALLKNQISQNNMTAAYIVVKNTEQYNEPVFVDPITKTPLVTCEENFLFAEKSGRIYPILKNIPILRKECSILATAYTDSNA